MKYSKLEAVLVFGLLFNKNFIDAGGHNQSPDYILEKFNKCFRIDDDKFKPVISNTEMEEYIQTWKVPGNDGHILNIIAWLTNPSNPNTKRHSWYEKFYHNFELCVCDFKDLHINPDGFMILHFVTTKAINRVLREWEEKSHYIAFNRTITISEITRA